MQYHSTRDKSISVSSAQAIKQGLSDEEIGELLVLDVKDAEYFESRGMTNQHGGGGLFAEDEEIMGWLFGK